MHSEDRYFFLCGICLRLIAIAILSKQCACPVFDPPFVPCLLFEPSKICQAILEVFEHSEGIWVLDMTLL